MPYLFIVSFLALFSSKMHFEHSTLNWISAKTIEKSYKSPHLIKILNTIKILNLDRCPLSDRSFIFLLKNIKPLPSEIKIINCRVTSRIFAEMKAQSLREVQQLNLCNNMCNYQIGLLLIRGYWREHLLDLYLRNNPIGDRGVRCLIYCKLNSIQVLELNQIGMTNIALNYLIKTDLPDLRGLDLSNNSLTDDGLKVLMKNQWIYLQSLSMVNSNISDTGLKYLNRAIANTKPPSLQSLQVEVIFENRSELISLGGLKNLIKDFHRKGAIYLTSMKKFNSASIQNAKIKMMMKTRKIFIFINADLAQ